MEIQTKDIRLHSQRNPLNLSEYGDLGIHKDSYKRMSRTFQKSQGIPWTP